MEGAQYYFNCKKCFQELYPLYKSKLVVKHKTITPKMLICWTYQSVVHWLIVKTSPPGGKSQCGTSSVWDFPVWLSLSFYLIADEVNIDNKHHQGVAHMHIRSLPHFLDGNLRRVQVCEANCWLCNKGGLLLVDVVAVAKICFVLLELIGLSPTRLNESESSFQSQEPCVLPRHGGPCIFTRRQTPLGENHGGFSTTN